MGKLTPVDDVVISARDRVRAAFVQSDLLPCPFCGRKPLSVGRANQESGNFVAQIFCYSCNAVMSHCVKGLDEVAQEYASEEVKRVWNRRAEKGT